MDVGWSSLTSCILCIVKMFLNFKEVPQNAWYIFYHMILCMQTEHFPVAFANPCFRSQIFFCYFSHLLSGAKSNREMSSALHEPKGCCKHASATG